MNRPRRYSRRYSQIYRYLLIILVISVHLWSWRNIIIINFLSESYKEILSVLNILGMKSVGNSIYLTYSDVFQLRTPFSRYSASAEFTLLSTLRISLIDNLGCERELLCHWSRHIFEVAGGKCYARRLCIYCSDKLLSEEECDKSEITGITRRSVSNFEASEQKFNPRHRSYISLKLSLDIPRMLLLFVHRDALGTGMK